jgi:hypothetical protein
MPQIDKKRVKKLHRRAMELSDRARVLTLTNCREAAKRVWSRAFRIELEAAEMVRNSDLRKTTDDKQGGLFGV